MRATACSPSGDTPRLLTSNIPSFSLCIDNPGLLLHREPWSALPCVLFFFLEYATNAPQIWHASRSKLQVLASEDFVGNRSAARWLNGWGYNPLVLFWAAGVK